MLLKQQNTNPIAEQAWNTPAPLRYDAVRIAIRRFDNSATPYFHATLQQRGAAALFDTFRPPEPIRMEAVRDLRADYDRQLRIVHEMAAAGIPMSSHALDRRPLFDLGRRVAEVLPLSVRQGLAAALQRAQERRHGLYITLELVAESQALLGIPWELMVLPIAHSTPADTAGEDFLLLSAPVVLVRQVEGIGRNTRPKLTHPLKLQAFAAAPADGPPIDAEPTRVAIEHATHSTSAKQCWHAGPGTLDMLQEQLRLTSPQIVHLLCHGEQSDVGRGSPRNDLLFTHRDGYTQRVNAFDLAPVLTLAPDLQCIVLQACHAGVTASALAQTATDARAEKERRASESIALAFVRHGIAVVIAMQGAVAQTAAGAFAQAYYLSLAEGSSVEQAVAAGRVAMWADGGLADWSLPVIYVGSGQTEPDVWYTRLADRVDGWFYDPATSRSLRGTVVAISLTLLAAGLLRWLMLPPTSRPTFDMLHRPLLLWAGVGLIGPAFIAAAYRGARGRSDLNRMVQRAAGYARWMGAYLGFTIGGLAGLGLLAALWAVGVLEQLPGSGALMLFAGVLLSALFMSYTVARSQVRAALAIAPFEPTLFDHRTLAIVLFAMLLLLAAPFGLLPGMPFAFLLDPPIGALTMATALITMVLRFRS